MSPRIIALIAIVFPVAILLSPQVQYFIWTRFDLWKRFGLTEKEGQLIFDDGDWEIRKMPDGSTKVEWSTRD